jgi:hypothetical protein
MLMKLRIIDELHHNKSQLKHELISNETLT